MQTLIINEDAAWIVQAGAYDLVLRCLSAELHDVDHDLSDYLLRSQTHFMLERTEELAAELELEDSKSWIDSSVLRRAEMDGIASDEGLIDNKVFTDLVSKARTKYGLRPLAQSVEEFRKGVHAHFGYGYCDLTPLSIPRFRILLGAMFRLYDRARDAGPGEIDNESCDSLYWSSYLKALLRIDPRAGEDPDRKGILHVRDDASWTAPAWAYDLVLERFGFADGIRGSTFSETLLNGRVPDGRGECDLCFLNEDQFSLLLPEVEWLVEAYGQPSRGTGNEPEFRSTLRQLPTELATLFANDPRTGHQQPDL